MNPTFEQVETKYREHQEKIRALRTQAEELAAPILAEIAKYEALQKAKEDYLLTHGEIEAFGFITNLYLNGRDDKAAAKKAEQNVGIDMKKMEEWLLKMLAKVGNSIKTEFGTVYKARKESVGVADFEAYFKTAVLRPAAEALVSLLGEVAQKAAFGATGEAAVEAAVNILATSAPYLEALTKAANKTYVLDVMGEQDKKTGARPNPPPAGVDYKAFATVGVRKPGKE